MKRYFFIVFLLVVTDACYSQLVINELDSNTPSIDDLEIIELKSETPNFMLDGYVVVLFNGSNSGGNASYLAFDLDGYVTDSNGIFFMGSTKVSPVPDYILFDNTIQNGADAIAIYQADAVDFPEFTVATTTNLIDALAYDTNDANDTTLLSLLGLTDQINEDENGNQEIESIQRTDDGAYEVKTPSPGALNDGTGTSFNGISVVINNSEYAEGDAVDIVFTTEQNVTSDLILDFSVSNGTFDTVDYTGSLSILIPSGSNTVTNTIQTIDDTADEGDEVMKIVFGTIPSGFKRLNDNLEVRIIDNDFVISGWGTPLNPTFGNVASTAPDGYYDSLNRKTSITLRQAIEDIIANPTTVRIHSYADIIDILKAADQSPSNSNQIWLLYTEQQRSKLDVQNSSDNIDKWNREHVYPRSRGGFEEYDEFDDIADGIDFFVTTTVDSLRHGNSDAHALRAADAIENSTRNNSDYGEYSGPLDTEGSWKGDVARSIFYMTIRYDGLEVVPGNPDNSTVGALGDLDLLLEWHRNDPPDDYEMHRNNVVYQWQRNRNPFIDKPDLVEYLWGNLLSVSEYKVTPVFLYPNPVKEYIIVSANGEKGTLEIINGLGENLLSTTFEDYKKIDVNFSSGIYFARIQTDDSEIIKKIIVR